MICKICGRPQLNAKNKCLHCHNNMQTNSLQANNCAPPSSSFSHSFPDNYGLPSEFLDKPINVFTIICISLSTLFCAIVIILAASLIFRKAEVATDIATDIAHFILSNQHFILLNLLISLILNIISVATAKKLSVDNKSVARIGLIVTIAAYFIFVFCMVYYSINTF